MSKYNVPADHPALLNAGAGSRNGGLLAALDNPPPRPPKPADIAQRLEQRPAPAAQVAMAATGPGVQILAVGVPPGGGAPLSAQGGMSRGGHPAAALAPSYGDVVFDLGALASFLQAGGNPHYTPVHAASCGTYCCPTHEVPDTEIMCLYAICLINPCGVCFLWCRACAGWSGDSNRDGNTLVHFAARYGSRDAAIMLLRAGADPNVLNLRGETPAAYAARCISEAQLNKSEFYENKVRPVVQVLNEAADYRDRVARAAWEAKQAEEFARVQDAKLKDFADQQVKAITAALPQRKVAKLEKKKQFAFFLSHYKAEAGITATLLFQVLVFEIGLLKEDVFLDTEGLKDLRELKDKVLQTDTLVVLLTKGYLSRPWCLIEIYEAIQNNVDIKPIVIEGGGYSFEDAAAMLRSDDPGAALNAANPGAGDRLVAEGYDPKQMCSVIASTLPYLIAHSFNPQATLTVKKAQIADALGLTIE